MKIAARPAVLPTSFTLTPLQVVLLLERERLLLVEVPLGSAFRRDPAISETPLPLLWDSRALAALPHINASDPSTPHFIFVARKGLTFDSHECVQEVLEKGGLFVGHDTITGRALEKRGMPPEWVDEVLEHPFLLLVSSADVALRKLLKLASGVNDGDFTTIAITGTNGKTSTTQILGNALAELSTQPVLRLGTLGIQLEGDTFEGDTPTMPDYAGFLAAARAARLRGAKHIVMEATSQGLDQGRMGEWQSDVAVYTNLTQDHLDYHGDMESYAEAKGLLFEGHLKASGTAVVNVSDAHWERFVAKAFHAQRHAIGVGLPNEAEKFFRVAQKKFLSARYVAIAQRLSFTAGIRGVWRFSSERHTISEVPFSLALVGDFQHDNAAGAAAALLALGYPLEQVAQTLSRVRLIPGRLEPVPPPAGVAKEDVPTVLVDYAHSPDALEKTLLTCRSLLPKGGRLWCVFGCGGDRDASKRPLMGAIAAELADACYVTSDNPRTESPDRILSDIVAGVPARLMDKINVNAQRSQAIAEAVALAAPSDVVVIAGKGHEDYQIMGTIKSPFSDAKEAAAALAGRKATPREAPQKK